MPAWILAAWRPLAGVALVVGAWWLLSTAWTAHNHTQQALGAAAQRDVDQRETDKLKAAARAELETLTKQRDDAKAQDEATRADMARKDVENERKEKDAARLLADARRAGAGRLRDPYASAACGPRPGGAPAPGDSGTGAGARDGDGAETGGLVSAEFSQFLDEQAVAADEQARAYALSRADARALRAQLAATCGAGGPPAPAGAPSP